MDHIENIASTQVADTQAADMQAAGCASDCTAESSTSANAGRCELGRREFVGLSAAALASAAALSAAPLAGAEETAAGSDPAASDAAAGVASAAESDLVIPEVGAEIAGFKVVDQHRIDYLDVTCVRMEHEKTGANLIYAACEDTDRAFCIGFRTPAPDDKGIPHVFEHSTLCGSDKYPDPSLFFSMCSQTYNTYLNAATYPYCTLYPAASLSEDQLYVYVDYILSGVFHPTIMNDERAMMREAYRYELTDRDADITLTGTVYSEMRGAMTQAQRGLYGISKMLYPGSTQANISGGDPAVIPTMTHQDLIDFHNSYYHPSNSTLALYGKIDLEKFLARIDGYLSEFEKAEIAIDDPNYQPIEGFVEGATTFPTSEGTQTEPYAYYGISLDGTTESEESLATQFISTLCTAGSPLDRLFSEKFPAAQPTVAITSDTMKVPTLLIAGVGDGVEDAEAFKQVIDDALAETLEQGVGADLMKSQCQQLRFALGMEREDSGFAADLAISLVKCWGKSGDPDSYKASYDIAGQIEDYAEQDGLTAFLRERLGGSQRSGVFVVTAEPGGAEREEAELKQSLVDMKAAMTDEEIDALIARTQDFAAWTEANAQSSGIDAVKAVDVASLPEEGSFYSAETEVADGITYVTSEVESGDLVYLELRFDPSFIPADQLFPYSLAAQYSAFMGTASHTADEMLNLSAQLLYQFTVSPTYFIYKDGGYRPSCTVSGTFLKDQVNEALDYIDEVLFDVDFSDIDRLRSKMTENVLTENMAASVMPLVFLDALISQRAKDGAEYAENTNAGFGFSRWQREMAAASDEELGQVAQVAQEVWAQVPRKENLIIGIAGNAEGIAATRERLAKTIERLDSTVREAADYSGLEGLEGPVALEIPGTLMYNYQFIPASKYGMEYDGKLLAVQSVVADKIMMGILRFQNSAYGADCGVNEDFAYVSSYRDPEYDKTFEVYEQVGDLVKALDLTQDDLDGYITSAFSSLATPVGPLTGAKTAIGDAIAGRTTFADKQRYMGELKQLTVADFAEYASLFDRLATEGERVCIGAVQVVEEHQNDYATIIRDYVE